MKNKNIDTNHGLLAMVNESSFQSNSNLDVIAIATATISSLQTLPPLSLPIEQQQHKHQQENQHQQEYQQQQQQEEQSSKILLKSEQFSWKFFDNELTILEHLTGVQDENSSSDNIKYIINDEDDLSCQQQNLLIPKEDNFHLPIIMSSSKTINAIRQNHSQINNNNKNNNHNNNNKNNSNNNNISNNNNNSIISNSINNNNNNNSSINTNGNSNNNTVNRLGGNGEADSNCSIGTSRAGTLFNYNLQGIEYATSTDAFYNNNTTTTQAAPSTTPTTIPFTRTQVQAATGQKLYNSRNINSMTGVMSFHLGLHGWRKKCLYVLILGLMLLIIVNLILTLWILKVMEFSSEGMGQLKIVAGGIQLSGQALIMDLLRASAIRSRHGQPISIESSRNFSIYTRGPSGELENHLFLGHDKLECTAKEFRINDTHGNNLFSVNQKEVTIGAHTVKIDGEGGAVFRESIQTPHVRAEAGRELRLESPTRQLNIASAKELTLQTRAGSIEMISLDDIKLSSNEGGIRLDSSKVFLPNLRTVQPITTSGIPSTHDHSHRVYQLCACSNGKLFLAPPHSICAGDDSTVCR